LLGPWILTIDSPSDRGHEQLEGRYAETDFKEALRRRMAKRLNAVACARCGNVGEPHQLDDLLELNIGEPIIVLCGKCLHSLKYADASTWKWFREYRDRLKG
jgi:hypothetical protein